MHQLDDVERKRAEVEILLTEYEADISAYAKWLAEWRERNLGFRCKRDSQVFAA